MLTRSSRPLYHVYEEDEYLDEEARRAASYEEEELSWEDGPQRGENERYAPERPLAALLDTEPSGSSAQARRSHGSRRARRRSDGGRCRADGGRRRKIAAAALVGASVCLAGGVTVKELRAGERGDGGAPPRPVAAGPIDAATGSNETPPQRRRVTRPRRSRRARVSRARLLARPIARRPLRAQRPPVVTAQTAVAPRAQAARRREFGFER